MNKKNNCPGCGTEIELRDNFCRNCGKKLSRKQAGDKKEESNLLSGRIVYIFTIVIIVLVVLIFVLNSRSGNTKPVEAPQQTTQLQGSVPMVDHQKISELKSMVSKNPEDASSIIVLANLLHDSGLPEDAITYYKKFLSLRESDPDARVDLGICYFELGDNASAKAEMEKAIKQSPKHQKAHFNLGIINLKEGSVEKANEYFKKCYELDASTPTGMEAKRIMEQHQSLKSKK